ncbi:hypothetical protein [Palleronia caenipelagi]|uniref:Uncharacterized protein n=1 Tax=Palleronia caenipelagi TaxID=2489174 RepID=A0A547QA94_9RHOB|nr:hypothetical protein [Palleronia caenipelagi]TRD23272.1 hypothetical protein FEV53_01560 [Palleronia caenipelagi]
MIDEIPPDDPDLRHRRKLHHDLVLLEHERENEFRKLSIAELKQRLRLRRLSAFLGCVVIFGMGSLLYHLTHSVLGAPHSPDEPSPYTVDAAALSGGFLVAMMLRQLRQSPPLQ